MRMRAKPYARGELAACPFFISSPERFRNCWKALFARPELPLYIELGCGKGAFAVEFALRNPQCNILAVDIKSEVLVVGKRAAESSLAAAGKKPDNIRFTALNVELIAAYLGSADTVRGIFINFCNPWPKDKHRKRRLTHPKQLNAYRAFLCDNGFVALRTDDRGLYEDTLKYFTQCGYILRESCTDMYSQRPDLTEYETEHQLFFSQQGLPIYYALAEKTDNPHRPSSD